jgi:hypothetical protein
MVPCQSNTSQSFPMFNELTNEVSEFYKCDCQDIFFDVLCTELNLEGVVYFFQNTLSTVVKTIESHFLPVEKSILHASASTKLDSSISNVLKKKYQSSWKQIFAQVISDKFCAETMQNVQNVLAIGENENEDINQQIIDFVKKCGEISLKMMISDPPLAFDYTKIGDKMYFNQHKQESLDGFIKSQDESYVILPTVFKIINPEKKEAKAQLRNKANSIIGTVDEHSQVENVIKQNVLPLNYEFA